MMRILLLFALLCSLSCGLGQKQNNPSAKETPKKPNIRDNNLPVSKKHPLWGDTASPSTLDNNPAPSYDGQQPYDSPLTLRVGEEGKFPDLVGVCKEVQSVYTSLPELTTVMALNDINAAFLDAHNRVRKAYGLVTLKWNNEIARYAQEWANYLRDNNNCEMMHRSAAGKFDGKRYGENLAWFSYEPFVENTLFGSAEKSVFGWSEECKDYSYERNDCTPGQLCGHFTQMVWNTAREVGCGMAICINGKKRDEVYVCNYDPPGNMSINGVKQKPF